MTNKKIIVISVLIFILISVGSIVYFLIPKSYIVFQVAPEQVAVLIDNKDRKNITNGDSITVSPGKHSITIFRDEFNPSTTNIDVKNGETTEVVTALIGLTENARKLLNNDKSNSVIEKATGIRMDKQVKLTSDLNPIMTILPIENRNYVISSCSSQLYPDNPNKIALCVDIPSDEFIVDVKTDIKSHGFNPEDYEYIWNNYLSGVE